MDVEAVLRDRDDVGLLAGVGDILAGEAVLADDAAAFADTEQRSRLREIGVLEARNVLFDPSFIIA